MRCVVWPSSRHRFFIHVPMGASTKGSNGSFNQGVTNFCWYALGVLNLKDDYVSLPILRRALTFYELPKKGFNFVGIVSKVRHASYPVLPLEKQSLIGQEDFTWKSTPVLRPAKQSKLQYWVQKKFEVFEEDFSNLWIVSRHFEFDKWYEISNTLKLYLWYSPKLVEEYFKRDPFFYSFGL